MREARRAQAEDDRAAAFQERQDEQGTSAPRPDNDTLGGGRTPELEWRTRFDRNPAAEAAANAAVSGSRISRNVNTVNARQDQAIAASPPAYMPDSRRFIFPDIPRTANGSPAVAPENVQSLLGYGRTPTGYRGETDTNAAGAKRYFDARAAIAPRPIGQQITGAAGVAAGLDPLPEFEVGTEPNDRKITSVYGTASVHPPTWQETVVAKHPSIHQAGTPENTEFVRRYKAATAAGQQPNPMALADTIASEIAASRKREKLAVISTRGIPGGSPSDYQAIAKKAPAVRLQFNPRS